MTILNRVTIQHSIKQVALFDLLKISQLATTPVIDCRASGDFVLCHLDGSTSIPADELFQRMHELPQRHINLALYGDDNSLVKSIEFLTQKGYTITQIALWPNREALAKINSFLFSGVTSKQLWQPAKIIHTFIDHYLPKLQTTTTPKGLDIACGSGRDMISLAQHGLEMTGVDYHSDALTRANRLAKSNQLKVNTIQMDLESNDSPMNQFEPEQFHLISVLRYLHRPLLAQLDRFISPGGFILYQTFMQGCEAIGTPKNPRFLLKENELNQVFSGYTMWLDEIHTLEDGRPVSAFIAQKPSEDLI